LVFSLLLLAGGRLGELQLKLAKLGRLAVALGNELLALRAPGVAIALELGFELRLTGCPRVVSLALFGLGSKLTADLFATGHGGGQFRLQPLDLFAVGLLRLGELGLQFGELLLVLFVVCVGGVAGSLGERLQFLPL